MPAKIKRRRSFGVLIFNPFSLLV
uniref:Uncharacterized protein n=1 Tax=mine drainage metagenome TaxID=410659 RepID=E6QWD5_9ZZZZ